MDRGFGRFSYKNEFPQRTMIARIMRAERIGRPPYGRTSFELDAIDAEIAADRYEETLADSDMLWPLAVLRIVTTERRFAEMLDGVPEEGSWLELEIVPAKRRRPIVYHSQLGSDGYTAQGRGSLGSARILYVEKSDKPVPRSAGAMAAGAFRKARQLAAACQFPQFAVRRSRSIRTTLRNVKTAHHLIVRDVGQASFVTLASEKQVPLLYVDAGWPISFNGRTAPRKPPPVKAGVPVVLTHWDFDHLLGFYRFPVLQNSVWITPVQNLGPGARRIANVLASKNRLHGYKGGKVSGGFGTLMCCAGAHPMNDTGLAVQARLSSGNMALIVGDADYSAVPSKARPDYLVVTHHGAHFPGPAPRPNRRRSPCVVSVGRGNVYRHPRKDALLKHSRAGWSIRSTASTRGLRRGDRPLGP